MGRLLRLFRLPGQDNGPQLFRCFRQILCAGFHQRIPGAESPRDAAGRHAGIVSGMDVHITVAHEKRLRRIGAQFFQNPSHAGGVRLHRNAVDLAPDQGECTGEIVLHDHPAEFVGLVGVDRRLDAASFRRFSSSAIPG